MGLLRSFSADATRGTQVNNRDAPLLRAGRERLIECHHMSRSGFRKRNEIAVCDHLRGLRCRVPPERHSKLVFSFPGLGNEVYAGIASPPIVQIERA